jgi:hypothetical protein
MSEQFNPAGNGKKTLSLPSETPQAQPARVEAEKKQRRRRSDTSELRNLKLHVPKDYLDPKFSYRFVNDSPGRIQQMTQYDDWEIVQQSDENVPTRRHAGKDGSGQARTAILLRKPKEFFEEDKARKKAAIDEREEGLRRGVTGDPGGLSGPNAYVPGGSNTITRGR